MPRGQQNGARVLAWGLACLALAVTQESTAAEVPAATQQALLAVTDPRPVAQAMVELTARYGYLITYEDPEFVFGDDIQDATSEVRRDAANYPPGKAPKVLVPAGGALNVGYEISSQDSKPADPLSAIQRVLEAQAATARGGVFRAVKSGEIVHVIPAQVRDASGNWVAQGSVLDARISIADAKRTVSEMLVAICAAVSKTSKVPLVTGGGPSFYEEDPPVRGAHDEVARDVLVRTLKATGRQVVWQIFYAPDFKWKFLNLRIVPQGSPLQAAPALQLPPPPSNDSGSFKRVPPPDAVPGAAAPK